MAHGGKRAGSGRKPGPVMPAKLELADMAKDKAQDALDTLSTIFKDDQQPASARVSAAIAILDRGFGRPFQSIHHAGHDGGPAPTFDAKKLSVDALREIMGALNDEAPDTNEG